MSILKNLFARKSKAKKSKTSEFNENAGLGLGTAAEFLGRFVNLCAKYSAIETLNPVLLAQNQGKPLGITSTSEYVLRNEIVMYQIYVCNKALERTKQSTDFRELVDSRLRLSMFMLFPRDCFQNDPQVLEEALKSRFDYYQKILGDSPEINEGFFQVLSQPIQKAIQCGKNLPLKQYSPNAGLGLVKNYYLMSALMDFGIYYLIAGEIMLNHLMEDTTDFSSPLSFLDRFQEAICSLRKFSSETEVPKQFSQFIDEVEDLWDISEDFLQGKRN